MCIRDRVSALASISVVFPAWDEAENLPQLLEHALETLPRFAKKFEIIVVDDGSSDATPRIATRYPRVRLLRHTRNRGYGAALRTGLRAARYEWVFFSDADLQFDLGDLESLIAASQGVDVIAGYRVPRRDPWGRLVLAALWGGLVRALFRLRVRDIDCAFKLFRRRVVEAIPIESVGAFVNTELLVRARAAGFKIRQVPVRHFPRPAGRASGARPRVILRALYELIALQRRLR